MRTLSLIQKCACVAIIATLALDPATSEAAAAPCVDACCVCVQPLECSNIWEMREACDNLCGPGYEPLTCGWAPFDCVEPTSYRVECYAQ